MDTLWSSFPAGIDMPPRVQMATKIATEGREKVTNKAPHNDPFKHVMCQNHQFLYALYTLPGSTPGANGACFFGVPLVRF